MHVALRIVVHCCLLLSIVIHYCQLLSSVVHWSPAGDRKGSMIASTLHCVLLCWGVHFMRGRHSLGHGFYLLVRHDHNLDLQNASGTSANHNTNTNTQVEDRQIRYYITYCRSYFCIFPFISNTRKVHAEWHLKMVNQPIKFWLISFLWLDSAVCS